MRQRNIRSDAAPVDEQLPQPIAESDTPVAQEVIADAEPVAETADASITVAGRRS